MSKQSCSCSIVKRIAGCRGMRRSARLPWAIATLPGFRTAATAGRTPACPWPTRNLRREGRRGRYEALTPATAGLRVPARKGDAQSSSRWSERSEEHTSELQSRVDLVCRLLLEKKKKRQRK